MVGPAFVVGRGLVDDESASGFGQLRRGELIVDSPTHVVVEGTATLAPPRVRALDIAREITHHIHELQLTQPLVDVGPFLGKESGMRLVGLGVLDVERGMRDIEIAA